MKYSHLPQYRRSAHKPASDRAETPHLPVHIIAVMSDCLDDLTLRLREFANKRDWEQFHTPKNLTMALVGEAGELAAEMQWLTPWESAALTADHKQRVCDEMADVLNYLVRLADVLDVDLIEAAAHKNDRNEHRFPSTAGP